MTSEVRCLPEIGHRKDGLCSRLDRVMRMARTLRFEFLRAVYHIINRGNCCRWIFAAASTRTAFEACLFEGCERSGWLLHAFVIM